MTGLLWLFTGLVCGAGVAFFVDEGACVFPADPAAGP